MKTRRLFIKDIIKVSYFGGLYTLGPSTEVLDYIKNISGDFAPHEFDAWEDEFQAIYKSKKNELDLTVQETIKKRLQSQRKSYNQGEAKSGYSDGIKNYLKKTNYKKSLKSNLKNQEDIDTAYDYFSEIPKYMSSPYSNIYLDKNKSNSFIGNQCFRVVNYNNSEGNLVMIIKKDPEISKNTVDEFIMIHPVFNSIIGDKKYFCYGVPIDLPTINKCSFCHQYYFTQVFGYKPNDPINGTKPVFNELIFNPYCPTDSDKNPKLHNGVSSVSDLITCTCYEDIKPLQLNSGNL